jgi:hypothetical protein
MAYSNIAKQAYEKTGIQIGGHITYIGYKIINTGADGLVLTREGKDAKLYECHLGNFGDDLDLAKQYAILHYMIARPGVFAATICYRMMGRGGQFRELSLFERELKKDGFELPSEITPIGDMNYQIGFNGKQIKFK